MGYNFLFQLKIAQANSFLSDTVGILTTKVSHITTDLYKNTYSSLKQTLRIGT